MKGIVFIPTKHGTIKMDAPDYVRIKSEGWSIKTSKQKCGYILPRVFRWNNESRSTKYGVLSRLIMCPGEEILIDHISRDTLDNTRKNLRECSRGQNAQNAVFEKGASKFKGVARARRYKKPWRAYITIDKERIELGRYTTQEEAARAYDAAALKYFGEFARLNFAID